MFACLFNSKTKAKSRPDDDYSNHLPVILYDFLDENGLLSETPKKFSYTSSQGNKAIAEISARFHPAKIDSTENAGQIILRIYRSEDQRYSADNYVFTNKFLYQCRYADQGSMEQVYGVNNGWSSNKEALKATPKEIKKLIKRLNKFMEHGPVDSVDLKQKSTL